MRPPFGRFDGTRSDTRGITGSVAAFFIGRVSSAAGVSPSSTSSSSPSSTSPYGFTTETDFLDEAPSPLRAAAGAAAEGDEDAATGFRVDSTPFPTIVVPVLPLGEEEEEEVAEAAAAEAAAAPELLPLLVGSITATSVSGDGDAVEGGALKEGLSPGTTTPVSGGAA